MNVIETPLHPNPTPPQSQPVIGTPLHPLSTPPQSQPHMISGQCLCVQMNMNVIGTPPHPCVYRRVKVVCADESETVRHARKPCVRR